MRVVERRRTYRLFYLALCLVGLYLWLLGRVLACDFLEVLHGGFDDRDAAEKKLLELARLWSQILVAVLLLAAAQVVAKHGEKVFVRLDAHDRFNPYAEAAGEGDSSLWLLLEQVDAKVRCRVSPSCTKVLPGGEEMFDMRHKSG
jgi:hypothetical protein